MTDTNIQQDKFQILIDMLNTNKSITCIIATILDKDISTVPLYKHIYDKKNNNETKYTINKIMDEYVTNSSIKPIEEILNELTVTPKILRIAHNSFREKYIKTTKTYRKLQKEHTNTKKINKISETNYSETKSSRKSHKSSGNKSQDKLLETNNTKNLIIEQKKNLAQMIKEIKNIKKIMINYKTEYKIAYNVYVSVIRYINKLKVPLKMKFIGTIIDNDILNGKDKVPIVSVLDYTMIEQSKKLIKEQKDKMKNFMVTLFGSDKITNNRAKKSNNILETKKLILRNKFENNKTLNTLITNVQTVILEMLKEVNKECITYNSELNYIDVFYSVYKSVADNTMTNTNLVHHLRKNNIARVTASGLQKKRTRIDYNYFKIIYEHLLNMANFIIPILKTNSIISEKVYTVDGTTLNFLLKICEINNNFKPDHDKDYSKVLLNIIHELKTDTGISIDINGKHSEPEATIRQIANLDGGSVLLGDGHYFEKNLIIKLHKKGIFTVFKVPKSITECKEFLHNNYDDADVSIHGINYRLIRCVYDKFDTNGIYVLGTTLPKDKYSNEIIEQLYKQRWYIEEYIKVLKCSLNIDKTKSKTFNNIMQELYMSLIIATLAKYMEVQGAAINNHTQKYKHCKINQSNFLKIMNDAFIFSLLYKNNTKNISKLVLILYNLVNEVTKILDNRNTSRHKILPVCGFRNSGKKES